jgi:tetratricopeptide (TPR) repeat protein
VTVAETETVTGPVRTSMQTATKSSRGVAAALAVAALSISAATAGAGCGGASANQGGAASASPIAGIRRDARDSDDGEEVGRWLLAELLAPGGDAAQAATARKRLDGIKHDGMYAGLARGMTDELHGAPHTSADAYVATLKAAQTSRDPDAPLVAWYAAHHLLGLRGAISDLYGKYKATLDPIIAAPGNLGWRAATELVEWSSAEAFDKAETTGDAYDAEVRARSGCAKGVRLAGPFGHGTAADRRRTFDAERPGPWPPSWPADPLRGNAPRVLKTEQRRCLASTTERTDDGVFYAQTFFTTKNERDVLVAVAGAVKVWIDDAPLLERDLRDWGSWQRFGVAAHVGAGRHRVLARVLGDASSVRILNLDGSPADVPTDDGSAAPYAITPARAVRNPNPIEAIVAARKAASPLQALLASYAAHIDGMDDVASVLLEPYGAPEGAAALTLAHLAIYAGNDAALPNDVRQRTQKELQTRAVKADKGASGGLWYSQAWLILNDAEQKGLVDAVEPLRKLALAFPAEPEVMEQLARVYGRLEWHGERMATLVDLEKRFPDDLNALRLYLDALEEDGATADADKVAARIKKLDADAEVDLDRALARHDWKAAIAELERIGKRRPDRKEIATRIADVLARGGDPSAAATQLEKALAKNPEDATARFRLADRAYAKGDTGALRRALADGLQAGAKTTDIRAAIDLLEGATYLEPWRVDGRKAIKEFEAWEKKGKRMEGTAARVLDYAAVWVHPDGSSEMLEHEIQRIQSQEQVGKESEQQSPTGLTLRLRVLKADGSMLEPEPVAGKPTLTMPHLEVGDYIEIEHITSAAGDGQKGRRYRGPHWFFREADKGYWRSEFIAITPKDRALEVETRGNVGAPVVRELRTFVERRWRVDESPPVPDEPDSPPPQEFLPSVRIGWGVNLPDTLSRLVDLASDETPLDPRLHARALEIVRGVPEADTDERARRVYKDVSEHIEDGEEADGRRVIFGKSGSRQAAFQHLMRQLGIPIEAAIVKNRLATPPLGKMSEVETYDALATRVSTDKGIRWLTVRDKFAPYGFIPAEMRGQPAFRLVDGTPKDIVTSAASVDGVTFEGRADLREDGSATVELVQSFSGKVGIQMRNVFDKVPEGQVHDFVEARLIGRNLPGSRVRELKLENKQDLGSPLVLRTKLEVPQLARAQGDGLSVTALFAMHLAQLATLPERQTPLFLPSWTHVEVRFEIVVPEKMRMPASIPTGEARDGERIVKVNDTVHGHALVLDRVVDIPAGRVQPGEYARFQRFAQEADALLERDIVVAR